MSTRTKAIATTPALTADPDSVTVIAGYGLAVAKALDYRGVDSRRVFAAAGIHEALRNDPLSACHSKRLRASTARASTRPAILISG
jgi:hypothetical protein